MIGSAIRQTSGWQGRQRPALDPIRVERNAQIVQRFAAGARYTELARTFGLTVHGLSMIVHRYALLTDAEAYWRLRRDEGRSCIPHQCLRAHIRQLLDGAEARGEASPVEEIPYGTTH